MPVKGHEGGGKDQPFGLGPQGQPIGEHRLDDSKTRLHVGIAILHF